MAQNWLDYSIIAVIGLSMLTGLFRGFIKEVIALCVWILAIWLAYHYSYLLDSWLSPYVEEATIRQAVGFIAIMISVLIIGGIFNAVLGFLLKRSGLSGTDRILGMGFGFARGVFIVALAMLIIKLTSLPYKEYNKQSKLYAKFDPLVDWLSGLAPDFINKVKHYDKTTGSSELAMDDDVVKSQLTDL